MPYSYDDFKADDYMELGRQPEPATGAAARTTPAPSNNNKNRGFRVQFRAFVAMAVPYFYITHNPEREYCFAS